MAWRIDDGQDRLGCELYRCITGDCEKEGGRFVDGDQGKKKGKRWKPAFGLL